MSVRGRPPVFPRAFRGGPSRGCPFGPQLPFHLVDGAHHRQEASPGGGAGIDVLSQRDEVDLLAFERLRRLEQMHQGARHAAQLGHDQCVAGADVLHELIPTWPIHAGAGHLVGEDLFAPRRFQGVDLRIEILPDAADAGISDSRWMYVHSAES